MRYPPSEKLEIIRLVEQSRLPVRRTLEHLGLPRSTFYRWYDQYGLVTLLFRSLSSFRRPFVRKPRGFFHPAMNVADAGYRTR